MRCADGTFLLMSHFSAMKHYFIDTSDGDQAVIDNAGHRLADDETARKLAMRALADMVHDHLPDGNHRRFVSSIRNDAKDVIFTATLQLSAEWHASDRS
jgi:hypothetical protein